MGIIRDCSHDINDIAAASQGTAPLWSRHHATTAPTGATSRDRTGRDARLAHCPETFSGASVISWSRLPSRDTIRNER